MQLCVHIIMASEVFIEKKNMASAEEINTCSSVKPQANIKHDLLLVWGTRLSLREESGPPD